MVKASSARRAFEQLERASLAKVAGGAVEGRTRIHEAGQLKGPKTGLLPRAHAALRQAAIAFNEGMQARPKVLGQAKPARERSASAQAENLDPEQRGKLQWRFVVELLRVLVRESARGAGEGLGVFNGKLFRDAELSVDGHSQNRWDDLARVAAEQAIEQAGPWPRVLPEELGELYEQLMGLDVEWLEGGVELFSTRSRKRTGSFFTPRVIASQVAERAFTSLKAGSREQFTELGRVNIVDPSAGGGAFLLATANHLLDRCRGRENERALRTRIALECLHGVDKDPLALAVCEAAVWLWLSDSERPMSDIGQNFWVGDALVGPGFFEQRSALLGVSGFDWSRAFPELVPRGFDLVVGNPPWVAYAGRATQPLLPALRAWFGKNYDSFGGYPTLQSLFVQRASELAPHGVVALLLPSSLADLAGYRFARRALERSHQPIAPLIEWGEDAFEGVTQPCFALIGVPRDQPLSHETASGAPWKLEERSRSRVTAASVEVPRSLQKLLELSPVPSELFKEMGFQTSSKATRHLLVQSGKPARRGGATGTNAAPGTKAEQQEKVCGQIDPSGLQLSLFQSESELTPLLEGKDIREFHQGAPRLYLKSSPELLKWAACRLRPLGEYQKVGLVVRQTAKFPIAARHTSGLPFRNSLIAGFAGTELPIELLLGLLNSAVYRAFHLSLQRDARQAAFPQVKLSHLRRLPAPPQVPSLWQRIGEVVREAEAATGQVDRSLLDSLVFELFAIDAEGREGVYRFLQERAPQNAKTQALR